MRAAACAALFFASCCAAGARTLLLLSPDALSSVTNVSVAPGEPALLASYLGGIGGGPSFCASSLPRTKQRIRPSACVAHEDPP
jgi:hypothetical protein